jgi:uncharacterized membrane protein YkvA (DUF1232 family)
VETNDQKVQQAADDGSKKVKRLREQIPKMLNELWQDIVTMVLLLRDYASGRYRQVPWHVISAVAGAIAYFAAPLDVVPDFMPALGYLDDAIVVKVALDVARADLKKYREWRKGRNAEMSDSPCPEGG